VIDLHTLEPGRQTALEVAERAAAFLSGARRSLDLALSLEPGRQTEVEVAERANAEHDERVFPPPPRTKPELPERLPSRTPPPAASSEPWGRLAPRPLGVAPYRPSLGSPATPIWDGSSCSSTPSSRARRPRAGRRSRSTTSCTRRSGSPTTTSSRVRSISRARASRTPRTCSNYITPSWPTGWRPSSTGSASATTACRRRTLVWPAGRPRTLVPARRPGRYSGRRTVPGRPSGRRAWR
jgi:hypothetical protein